MRPFYQAHWDISNDIKHVWLLFCTYYIAWIFQWILGDEGMMRPSVQGVDHPVCCVLDAAVTYARDSSCWFQEGLLSSRGGGGGGGRHTGTRLTVASAILCQSLLRTVDCQSIALAFWKLLVISQTRLLGFIFTAFMILWLLTTVVFSADQVVVRVAGRFQTLDFSMPLFFAIALIDFLFSFNIQIACFCLKVRSLVFILVCVHHHQMQDSEYRSNGYNWYDTFPAFNTCRMNATGHSWSLRKTREATVPILMLTSDRGMKR